MDNRTQVISKCERCANNCKVVALKGADIICNRYVEKKE